MPEPAPLLHPQKGPPSILVDDNGGTLGPQVTLRLLSHVQEPTGSILSLEWVSGYANTCVRIIKYKVLWVREDGREKKHLALGKLEQLCECTSKADVVWLEMWPCLL